MLVSLCFLLGSYVAAYSGKWLRPCVVKYLVLSLYSLEIGYALRRLVVVMSLCSQIFGYVNV